MPDRPEHHYRYDPAKSEAYTATTLAWLGDPAAEGYARHVLAWLESTADGPPRPRRAASARLDLSLALIAVGQHDEAAGTALEAITSGRIVPSNYWRARQVAVLVSAIHAGIPVDELDERINASERTQLLTGFALSAATRTAWDDKVRTLGRSLASGLLADDGAKIDTEQMIIAAIADIEGPQLAMLELLVAWRRGRHVAEPLISWPRDLPKESHRP